MVTKEALSEQLETLGCTLESDETLDKCVEVCKILEQNDAEQFAETWVAFSASHYEDFNVTIPRLQEMLKAEEKQYAVNYKPHVIEESNYNQTNTTDFGEDDDLLALYGVVKEPITSSKTERSPEVEHSTQDSKKWAVDLVQSPNVSSVQNTPKIYKDSGKVLLEFGQKINNWKLTNNNNNPSIGKGEQRHIKSDEAYGFELLSNKVKTLFNINKGIGKELCQAWLRKERTDISCTPRLDMKSQKPFRTWGRIRCDKTIPGKTVIYLEGSFVTSTEMKEQSSDRMENFIELDLSMLSGYSFYPGQIIAVEAVNPTGNTLVVSRIFDGPLLKSAGPPKLSNNLRMFVASGPFTTLDNLYCEPLWDLVDHVVKDEPHILLLCGPFFDFSHPELKDYKSMTYEDLFESTVTKLMEKLEGKCTRVIIVASHRDVHHDPVYPTPEYSITKSLSNLHFMPDPCTLSIDSLNISITTVDSIMHLGRQEVTLKPKNTDKLWRLANYILNQGFFYPLYPPAKEITMDTVLYQKHAYMEKSPHLLIIPSDMRHFCKTINDSVVINPERLSKRTYAKIEVRPSRNNAWSQEQVSCEISKL